MARRYECFLRRPRIPTVIFVHFPESNVLHLGDVFRTSSYPIIDVYNGGTLAGTIEALDLAISLADSNTNDFVPIVYHQLGGGSRYDQ